MENKRILIVEDEVIVAMTLEGVLQKLGYQVVGSVTNGPDAIQMAGDEMPDLVLMDIRLEGSMDGIEAATRISKLYSIPVVYLTAHSDQKTLSRAIQTQPYGYLLKPFRERDLYTTIEMAFHKHRVIRKTSEEVAEEIPAPVSPTVPEGKTGLERMVLDHIEIPVCVVDKNLRLVLFNDAFRCLCNRFSPSECRIKQMIYEAAPAGLVGSAKDYQEVLVRNNPLNLKKVFWQDEVKHALDIHLKPFAANEGEKYVATMFQDETRTEYLESRNKSLLGSYEDVMSLLGEFRRLNGNSTGTDLQQILVHAEEVVIALSRLDVERLKTEQNTFRKNSRENE